MDPAATPETQTASAADGEERLAETQALCPECLEVRPAAIVEREGKVWLRRHCPDHGTVETLVLSDAAWWRWSRKFLRGGRAPAHAATVSEHGCPYDCGFCPDHQQHACVTVFEITEACNLTCPACFAGEAHARYATRDDVRAMADGLLAAEGGEADVAMLSGGEPTLHPQFLDIVDDLRALPIAYTIVNSNGLRFARQPEFARQVAERDVLVYLQFDGFEPHTYGVLRGREDVLDIKLQALDNLTEAGARVVLVATVLKGLNDHEAGEIVRFGATHPAVRAVSLQPEFGEGRHVAFDPADRVTITDVIDAVGRTSGIFERDDFVPIPCCDPICTAASYAWVDGDDVTPVTRMVPVETYMEYLENTSMPNLSEAFQTDVDEMRAVLERLYSKSSPPGSERQTEAFLCACEPLAAELDRVGGLPGEVFAVTIEGFLDRHNFDVARVSRCCIQEALPDGRIVPFCAYNTLYRFAPDRRPVPGRLVPDAVVNRSSPSNWAIVRPEVAVPSESAGTLPRPPADGTALKCQCADLWSHPAAQMLLGESLRPGGAALTARLLDLAGLRDGALVVDVGCGPGSTSEVLADRGLRAVGVDYSPALALEAAGRSNAAAVVGDGERLPLRAGVADAVTIECVLSAVPDKRAAVDEARRVLAPDGWLLVSDMTLAEAFPEPLDTALAWVACAAGALRADGYVALLEEAGFAVHHAVDESPALAETVAKARRRLALFRGASSVGLLPTLEEFVGPDLAALGRTLLGHDDLADGGRIILTQVTDAVQAGNLGYLALVARRTHRDHQPSRFA